MPVVVPGCASDVEYVERLLQSLVDNILLEWLETHRAKAMLAASRALVVIPYVEIPKF